MRTVYRCVSGDNKGMYASPDSPYYEMTEFHRNHPIPDADPMLIKGLIKLDTEGRKQFGYGWGVFGDHVLFGFNSIAQLSSWIDKPTVIKEMSSKNYRILKLEVPHEHMIDGDFQVVYNSEKATLVESLPIEEFFDCFVFGWDSK